MILPSFNVPLISTPLPLPQRPARKAHTHASFKFQGNGSDANAVDTVEFSAGPQASRPESHQQHLERLQRHAQTAARLAPNYSGRHYAALVKLADGTEGISANVEASRQLTLCDLRLAIGAAQNQWIQKQSQHQQGPTSLPPVKTIYLVSANLKDDHPIPCADCQEWLASPICPPDTSVISLEKNAAGQPPIMRQRSVREMLPLYKGRTILSKTNRPMADLPVTFSTLANTHPPDQYPSLSPKAARDLMDQAQNAYLANRSLARDSRVPTGVAMLLYPSGRLITGARVDWSTRWHVPADLATVAAGLTRKSPEAPADENGPSPKPEKIQAVAYYGDDTQLPPITSLGRIARNRGSAETRILTIEDDTLQVRTIKDFLPELYRDGKGKTN
ncbi:hypothetical protein [Vampirovibrio chlorellavorus]|uniref:hypothetical protein n=1 Tax=Vampirovibrio chlorellavorus TaxID=758823 RepID=UPI0026F00A52|nr:hypothetical protein [Vampirovibrio chlorellavorus]